MILCRSPVLSGPQFLNLPGGAEKACLAWSGKSLEEPNMDLPLRELGMYRFTASLLASWVSDSQEIRWQSRRSSWRKGT